MMYYRTDTNFSFFPLCCLLFLASDGYQDPGPGSPASYKDSLFALSSSQFCPLSSQPCWGWACWQPDTMLMKEEVETCSRRFTLWQDGAIANSTASFASNSSFCRFSSISSSNDSLRKLSCSILASFFSVFIMLFSFLKTFLTAAVSFMVMCSRCESQRETVRAAPLSLLYSRR